MVGPDYSAYHIAQYQERGDAPPEEQERASLTTFVDLVLLARAHCLVWAPSGFPMMAMVRGGRRRTWQAGMPDASCAPLGRPSLALGVAVGEAGAPCAPSLAHFQPVKPCLVTAQTLGFNPCTIDIYACIREGRGVRTNGLSALPGLGRLG